MDGKDLLELAGAAWTIIRILAPVVAPLLPDWFGSAGG